MPQLKRIGPHSEFFLLKKFLMLFIHKYLKKKLLLKEIEDNVAYLIVWFEHKQQIIRC